jgi:hypothetical protein
MMKYFGRMLMLAALLVGSALSMNALDKSYDAETSKLATGKWVKVSVRESGIYQITADDARNWGLGSDLSQIHVFGYGGAPLSETMLGDNYADDLPQMPLVRTNDRILFYAQGPITWKRKSNKIEHLQVQHPYALAGFYFVTNDNRFSDIEPVKADNSPTGNVITTYTEPRLLPDLQCSYENCKDAETYKYEGVAGLQQGLRMAMEPMGLLRHERNKK